MSKRLFMIVVVGLGVAVLGFILWEAQSAVDARQQHYRACIRDATAQFKHPDPVAITAFCLTYTQVTP